MNIIAGCARNLILADLPDSEVRPTSGRARKALFDSLGDLSGKGILDLCAGSGALALESASRGASWAAMVEKDPAHVECIRENCRRTVAAGADTQLLILNFDVVNCHNYLPQLPDKPNIIFADPPYAVSAEIFHRIGGNAVFSNFTSGAILVWEIPDSPGAMGEFIDARFLKAPRFRRFGSTVFLQGEVK